MPGLKTTLTLSNEQFDAALVRSRAAAAVAGADIQRSLSMKIAKMEANISTLPQGQARLAAEQALFSAKMRLAVANERAITAMQIAENEKRIMADRAYFTQWAAMSAAARMRMKVADRVGAAVSAFSAAGGDAYAPKAIRDELAQALRAQRALRDFGGAAASLHGQMPGLNFVLRETLVIFREIGRGNWARVPGSFSLVIQGLTRMRSQLGLIGGLFTLTGAVAVLAVGGIVASFFIWEHRVNSLVKALASLAAPTIAPPDLTRLSNVEKGWIKIRDAIKEATDQANSANEAFERAGALLNQAQGTEKRLQEIRQQKENDESGNDPAKKAALRAKHNKEDHDLEFKQQQEQLAMLREKAEALRKERDEKKAAADAMKVESEEDEKAHRDILEGEAKAGSVAGEDYTKERKDKKGNVTISEMEQDQATVEKLSKIKDFGGKWMNELMGGITTEEKARLAGAQGRLSGHSTAVNNLAAYDKAKKDRDEARKEQQKLYDDAAKAGAGSKKAASDYAAAAKLDKRILADDDAIRGASAEEKGMREGLHVKSSLNSQQRIGAYSAAPGQHKIETLLEHIKQNTAHLNPQAHPPVGKTKTQYGGIHH